MCRAGRREPRQVSERSPQAPCHSLVSSPLKCEPPLHPGAISLVDRESEKRRGAEPGTGMGEGQT